VNEETLFHRRTVYQRIYFEGLALIRVALVLGLMVLRNKEEGKDQAVDALWLGGGDGGREASN